MYSGNLNGPPVYWYLSGDPYHSCWYWITDTDFRIFIQVSSLSMLSLFKTTPH